METSLANRGVTANALSDLIWGMAGNLNLQQTSRSVVADIIKQVTAADKCSFFEWIERHRADLPLDPSYDYVRERTLTGTPAVFVSHPWDGKFRDVMYVAQYLDGALGNNSTRAFWVDLFAINQHKAITEQLDQIEEAISQCERTVLVLDEDLAITLTRVWCVYELWISIREKRPIDWVFGAPNRIPAVLNALCVSAGQFAELDVCKADRTKPEDKENILQRIRSSKGTDFVNKAVSRALADAARNELLTKAHMPSNIMDEAIHRIKDVGWQAVRSPSVERDSVIGFFSGHVHYGPDPKSTAKSFPR